MALAQKHRRRYNEKQNSPNHKNGNLVKNRLLQPHLDNQRKLRILSQNPSIGFGVSGFFQYSFYRNIGWNMRARLFMDENPKPH
jgi:hypothetical protein